MVQIVRRGGKILRVGGKAVTNDTCCCGVCCDPAPPDTLRATITSCLAVSAYPEAGCTCDPFSATFNLTITGGIGCCDGSMDGSGSITIVVDVPP